MNAVKYILVALGLLFIIVGLAIAISDNPTYLSAISPIYTGMVYLFYGYIGLMFLAVLVGALRSFGNPKK